MEEIRVNDYIRTPYNTIEKIIKVEENKDYIGVKTDRSYYIFSWLKTHEVKHSSNIIDLIEVGDYVNGRLVLQVDYKNKNVCLLIPLTDTKANTNIMWYGYEDIKTIVTKEQFALAEYRLEE